MNPSVACIILAGGQSRRMGQPKALLPWGTGTLVEHLVRQLSPAVDQMVVVASADLVLPELDAHTVRDRELGLGPLGGIREGLHASTCRIALVTAVDHPFVGPDFVGWLCGFGETVACRVDGLVQPMPALYQVALAERADALIAAGRMRPQDLLEEAGYVCVDEADLPDRLPFLGCNTPEEYDHALRLDGQR